MQKKRTLATLVVRFSHEKFNKEFVERWYAGKMKKKLLTLDDLYNFYSTKKKSMNFSADKSGYNIAVQVNGKFEVIQNDNSEGLLYGKIKAFHDLGNRNKSYIETDILEKYLPSMKDRPIMADIIEVEDNNGNMVKDFNGHTMEIDEENDKIVYIESPVGHFVNPENFHLEYDKKYDRKFVIADVVIYEEYTDACDILRRRQETDCSVELCIRDMAYDCKTHELHINNFYVQGCTLLGAHVQPGMAGSKLSLKDFSEENNSVFSNLSKQEKQENQELIETLEKLNAIISNFNIKQAEFSANENSKEGGEKVTKFEELLERYNKTEKDIEFGVEGLTDEELETKFAEMFGEIETFVEVPSSEENSNKEDIDTVIKNESVEDNDNPESKENDEDKENEIKDNESKEEIFETIEKHFEVDGKKFSVSFTLSHEDIRCGLYGLLSQYEDMDNDWYDVRAVYDDYFVFQGWFTNKIYGQKYKKDGDTIALDGERYVLHEELLTDTELAQLNDMRANYSSIQTELNTYKANEEYVDKMEVFNDENYVQFLETPEFKELMSNEIVNKYSKEELEDKANIAFSKLVKKNKAFALETPTEEKSKVSSMFAFGKIENKSSFLDGLLNQKKN